MDPGNVMTDDIFPITTKLKANAWGITLRDAGIVDEFDHILVGLRQGLENFSLSCTSVPRNHCVSQEDEEFVIEKYAEEIELGKLSHGYKPDTLIGHFCTAPLAVIDQGCCKRRNHSYAKKN
jgi:hypothetical protein